MGLGMPEQRNRDLCGTFIIVQVLGNGKFMKAIKTKSGKWRCRPVDHYEYRDGKRIIVQASITRDTKRQAIQDALAYEYNHKQDVITFKEASERYFEMKEGVLSPTTVREYRSRSKAFDGLLEKNINEITSRDIQFFITKYSKTHAPKSVANANALILAILEMYRPGEKFKITLPKVYKKELYIPSEEDITRLLEHVKGTILEKAVLLAAFGTLRLGEVCAMTGSDIKDDHIVVNKSLAYNGSEWVVKPPKTASSVRTIFLPDDVLKRLRKGVRASDRIVPISPKMVRDRFYKALDELRIPRFRFHDLRVFAISLRHAVGIPDQYIMKDSGHKTDIVMKAVYRKAMEDKRRDFSAKLNEHLDKIANV